MAAQSVHAGFKVENGVNYLEGEATVTADSLPTLVNAALSVGTYHGNATMTLKKEKDDTVLTLPNSLFIGGVGYGLDGEPAHQGTVVLEQGTELHVGKETQSSGGHHIDVGNSAAGAAGFLQINGGTAYAGQLVIGNHTNSSGRVEVSDGGSVALSRDGFDDTTQIGLVIGNAGGAGTLIVDNASFTDTTGGQTSLGLTGTATVELKNDSQWDAAGSDIFLGDYQNGTGPLVGAEEHPSEPATPLPPRPTVEPGTQTDNGSGTDTLSLSGHSSLTAKSLSLLANADVTVSADSSLTINPANGGLWVYTGCVLTNNGRVDAYTGVYGGTLQGCGTMSTTIIKEDGKLIVGNSPGQQTYTGKLTVEGSVEFSVDDLLYGVPATAETAGWGNQSYSTIDMGGNQIFLNGCVTLTLGEVAMGQLNDSGRFELVLVQNIGNADIFTESLLASLLGQTSFADIDGELVSMNTPLLTGTHYEMRGNNLVLTNSTPTPEPATATLSLLALAAMASLRRRK